MITINLKLNKCLAIGSMLLFGMQPCIAYANTLTPLFWTGTWHLLIGNIGIAALESICLSCLSRSRVFRTFGLLIVANGLSAVFGLWIMNAVPTAYHSANDLLLPLFSSRWVFEHSYVVLALSLVFLWAATVFVETPLIYCSIPKQQRTSYPKVLLLSVILQTVSYALLIPYYVHGLKVGDSISVIVEDNQHFVRNKAHGVIYYIGVDQKSVWRSTLDGHEKRKISEIEETDDQYLCFTSNVGRTDIDLSLCKHVLPRSKGSAEFQIIAPRIATREEIGISTVYEKPSDFQKNTNELAGNKTRSFTNTVWNGHCAASPYHGLLFYTKKSQATFSRFLQQYIAVQRWFKNGYSTFPGNHVARISMYAPFQPKPCEYLTILPTEQFVFQFGFQIVLFDPQTRQIGYVATGSNPLVVWQKS